MCIYVGAIVRDKRFPEKILGTVAFVNSTTQIAIIETSKGLSAVPNYMIETVDKIGGKR